jgi:ribosomal protein L18E
VSSKLHVIYVPGVGDSNPVFQKRAVSLWRFWGIVPEFFQMNWADEIKWNIKFGRLISRIDKLTSEGKKVALVGASAGGAAVIAAYYERKEKLAGTVTICGKLKNAKNIGPKYRITNPALIDAITASDKAVKKISNQNNNILTLRAVFDEVVTTHDDSVISGARNRISPTFGHAITIALQLVFGPPYFIRYLKKQTKH